MEVLTPEVATAPGSMFRDHPDWVQKDITGKPNKFIGGEGRVFWVEPGTESAWLCPSSPYAEYFYKRVQRLARTALDGLWGDVPLLSDIVASWPCTCNYCKARFMAETGMATPSAVDWSSATFRRWVTWRHKLIRDFEQTILAKAREARADFQVVIETVTMDYTSGTVQGLDPATADDGDVLRVWEVDAVSDRSAMRAASADDWMDMAVMMKYGAGVSGHRPSWVFCYGIQPDDAEHVFGLALATGNNPFELKIPIMTETVSARLPHPGVQLAEGRGRAVHRLSAAPHGGAVFAGQPGLPGSGERGGAVFVAEPRRRPVVDHRQQRHRPPDAIRGRLPRLVPGARSTPTCRSTCCPPSGRRPRRWPATRSLVVPSAVALSDALMGQLAMFAAGGGTVIASGPDLGKFDDNGADRGSAALLTGLGVAPGGAWMRKASGSGFVAAGAERAGRTYLRRESQQAAMQISQAITQPQLVTDAPAAVVFGVRRTRDGKMLLVAANLDGLGASAGSFTPRPASFKVALSLEGRQATAVSGSQPGAGKAPDLLRDEGRAGELRPERGGGVGGDHQPGLTERPCAH